MKTAFETIVGNVIDDWETRGIVPEFIRLKEEKATERTKLEDAKAMLENGVSAEIVSRALKLPIGKIQSFQSSVAQ